MLTLPFFGGIFLLTLRNSRQEVGLCSDSCTKDSPCSFFSTIVGGLKTGELMRSATKCSWGISTRRFHYLQVRSEVYRVRVFWGDYMNPILLYMQKSLSFDNTDCIFTIWPNLQIYVSFAEKKCDKINIP